MNGRLELQEAQTKLDTDAMMDRMCELEQMVDDAGGAMDDIAVSITYICICRTPLLYCITICVLLMLNVVWGF